MMQLHGLIDIDDFTHFNLKHGYAKGNQVLEDFESYFKEIFEPTFFKRIGSDEFVLILPDSYLSYKHSFLTLFNKCQQKHGITISIGLLETESDNKIQRTMSYIRTNMLEAKRNGKNKICLT